MLISRITKLVTLNEQRILIEKLVKSNNKFKGNEDLLEDFCSETYKRSYSLFDTIEPKGLESYIAKVANTAILNVLKENGRVRRRENKYISTADILISPAKTETFVYDLPDPKDSFEEKIVRKDLLQKIVDIYFKGLAKLFEERDIKLEITDDAREVLATQGFNPVYGARPLKRTIRQLVENPLAKKLLAGDFKEGDTITVDTDGDEIIFR